jgi:peptide-methionine (S)-S-oxide reductase
MTSFSIFFVTICLPFCFNLGVQAGEIRDSQLGQLEVVTFAGGCFWCVEADFDHLGGVLETVSGYSGGTLIEPTYKEVAAGNTNHLESVQIFYDPETLTFQDLLNAFWHSIDPTDSNGQFCDRGSPYRTAIFTHTEEQQTIAAKSRERLNKSGILREPIATVIKPLTKFYPAEEYHQNFHLKNPVRYKYYRFRCGRDARLKELWGSDALSGIR